MQSRWGQDQNVYTWLEKYALSVGQLVCRGLEGANHAMRAVGANVNETKMILYFLFYLNKQNVIM
jgi:hypothetical protein